MCDFIGTGGKYLFFYSSAGCSDDVDGDSWGILDDIGIRGDRVVYVYHHEISGGGGCGYVGDTRYIEFYRWGRTGV